MSLLLSEGVVRFDFDWTINTPYFNPWFLDRHKLVLQEVRRQRFLSTHSSPHLATWVSHRQPWEPSLDKQTTHCRFCPATAANTSRDQLGRSPPRRQSQNELSHPQDPLRCHTRLCRQPSNWPLRFQNTTFRHNLPIHKITSCSKTHAHPSLKRSHFAFETY